MFCFWIVLLALALSIDCLGSWLFLWFTENHAALVWYFDYLLLLWRCVGRLYVVRRLAGAIYCAGLGAVLGSREC